MARRRPDLPEAELDLLVWQIRRETSRHVSRARIAKRLGLTVAEVEASLRRSGRRRAGQLSS